MRAAALYGFPELCRELGVDPQAAMIAHGLHEDVLNDPDNAIPLEAVADLLAHAAADSGCAHFGLLLGARQPPAVLGPLLLIMQDEPTVGASLAAMRRHFHFHNIGAESVINVEEDLVESSYVLEIPMRRNHSQGLQLALAVGCKLRRFLWGPGWQPVAAQFAFPPPIEAGPFQAFFRCPVTFDANRTSLFFEKHWLDQPLAQAKPLLGKALQDYLYQRSAAGSAAWSDQVRRVVKSLLPMGKADIANCARAYNMSRRTLHRRLAQENVTFEALLQDTRFEVAERLLEFSDAPLTEIAAHAGYSDASAFSRAFHRRHGCAPSGYRRTKTSDPDG